MLRSKPSDLENNQEWSILKIRGRVRQAVLAVVMIGSVAVTSEVTLTAADVNVAMAGPVDDEAEFLIHMLLAGIDYMPGPLKKLALRNAKKQIVSRLPSILENSDLTPKTLALRLEDNVYPIPPELELRVDELEILLKNAGEDASWEDVMPNLKVFANEISLVELESGLRAYDKNFKVDDQVMVKR